MRYLYALAVLIAAILAALIAIANRHMVMISLDPLPVEGRMPLYLLILICLFAGVVTGLLIGAIGKMRLRAELARARRRIASLERAAALQDGQMRETPAALPQPRDAA